ncbi:MAG: hypothetical protein KAS32_13940 [Candidatus Peribacteraceae bacterium]|nr:hypothetical protein [Candidatus Peribacteraceae bacterium]
MTKKTKKKNKITCPHCGYKYRPRIDSPKACPNCKQYYNRTTVKKAAAA